jgi:DNA-directed RNA polymerase specialized sigma24 family protein
MDAQPKSPTPVNHSERNGRLLDQLLARSVSRLRAQATRNAANSADAEDALQDACLQFLRFYRGPADLEVALPWLMLVTKRCAWALGRHGRREAPHFEAGLPAGTPEQAGTLCPCRRGPEELAELDAELSARWRMLERLKPDERRAILAFALGYSYAEICERFSWSRTKANRCLVEGRAALRRQFLDSGADGAGSD